MRKGDECGTEGEELGSGGSGLGRGTVSGFHPTPVKAALLGTPDASNVVLFSGATIAPQKVSSGSSLLRVSAFYLLYTAQHLEGIYEIYLGVFACV